MGKATLLDGYLETGRRRKGPENEAMKILVTAGATQTPIDQVRAITNIFKGKTGTHIALELALQGNPKPLYEVTLLTSNPDRVYNTQANLRVLPYHTFDDLAELMELEITTGGYDVIIHSAAVSDYKVSEVLAPIQRQVEETYGVEHQHLIVTPLDASTKIPGSYDRMYLELTPTFKIVDKIRSEWGFKGTLVKFKLQVGISDEELLTIARKSRATSDADLIVANCLEWSKDYAYVIGRDGAAEKVTRDGIAYAILRRLRKLG